MVSGGGRGSSLLTQFFGSFGSRAWLGLYAAPMRRRLLLSMHPKHRSAPYLSQNRRYVVPLFHRTLSFAVQVAFWSLCVVSFPTFNLDRFLALVCVNESGPPPFTAVCGEQTENSVTSSRSDSGRCCPAFIEQGRKMYTHTKHARTDDHIHGQQFKLPSLFIRICGLPKKGYLQGESAEVQ